MEVKKKKTVGDEEVTEIVKERLDYVSKVDINKVQEMMYAAKPLNLSANPKVRDWQKSMITRGL